VVVQTRPGKTRYDVGVLFCGDLVRLLERWPVLQDMGGWT
jgi:hypothetical protein